MYYENFYYLPDRIIYICDIKVFALLKITNIEILIYYFDLDGIFMSDIKITLSCAFKCFSNIVVKIISRSISIVNELNMMMIMGMTIMSLI